MKVKKIITKKRTDAIAKCLATMLILSKEEYEALTPDEYKNMFGDWTCRELNCLYKMYNDINI